MDFKICYSEFNQSLYLNSNFNSANIPSIDVFIYFAFKN